MQGLLAHPSTRREKELVAFIQVLAVDLTQGASELEFLVQAVKQRYKIDDQRARYYVNGTIDELRHSGHI